LLAGIFYPAVVLISTIPAPFGWNPPASTNAVALVLFTVMSGALFRLGYVLQADAHAQAVPA
jgi:hypothetical protein